METDGDGHAYASLLLAAPVDGEGPYTWLVTVTDPQMAASSVPADGVPAGYLAVDAPPVPTWYDSVSGASTGAGEGLTWSNDAAHSPYLLLVDLADADGGVAADIESVLLMSTSTGGNDHRYECSGGASGYCDGGGGAWTLSLPTVDLEADNYELTLLTADECITTEPLLFTIGANEDVDNDRDGVAESGVGPDHDCDDEDVANAAGADAQEAAGNETDLDAEAMTGDSTSGYTAMGNLHDDEDVDWWAFEVSGDTTYPGGNAEFVVEITAPGDEVAPYGDLDFEVERNVANGSTPNPDTTGLSVGADTIVCSGVGTCTHTFTVSGESTVENEVYWWLGIAATTWSPAMCDDRGQAYSIRVWEE